MGRKQIVIVASVALTVITAVTAVAALSRTRAADAGSAAAPTRPVASSTTLAPQRQVSAPVTTPAAVNALPAATTLSIVAGSAEWRDAVLDCLYAENAAGSCQRLVAAGFEPSRGYGLGDTMTLADVVDLRAQCLAGDPLSCGELRRRVLGQTGQNGDIYTRGALVCLFARSIAGDGALQQLDVGHLTTLLGPAGNPETVAALRHLAAEGRTGASLGAIDAFVGAVC